MTIIFNNTVMTTDPTSAHKLIRDMSIARYRWEQDGKPKSGDHS